MVGGYVNPPAFFGRSCAETLHGVNESSIDARGIMAFRCMVFFEWCSQVMKTGGASCENFPHDVSMHVREPEVAAAEAVGELCVIHTEEV